MKTCENCDSPIPEDLAYCENIDDCFVVLRKERDEAKASFVRTMAILNAISQVTAELRGALGVIVREVNPENCGFGYAAVIKNTARPALDLTLTRGGKIAEFLLELEGDSRVEHRTCGGTECSICYGLAMLEKLRKGE